MKQYLILFTFLLANCGSQDNLSPAAPFENIETSVDVSVEEPSVTNEWLEQVNSFRKEDQYCGSFFNPSAPKLVWNEKLEKAAIFLANDLAARQEFSHEDSNKSFVIGRVVKFGYDAELVGESIFQGENDFGKVMQSWQANVSDCNNMMTPEFRDFGFAIKDGYSVAVFGLSH